MKKWILIAIVSSLFMLAIGTYMWYRKRKQGNKTVSDPNLNSNPGQDGNVAINEEPTQIDTQKVLKESCIGTICPQSSENRELQRMLNAYLPRMNKILAGDIVPATDREKGIRSRFDKLFIDGKLKLKFQIGTNQIDPISTDGKFGKKTEQMLLLATGKTETSISALKLSFEKDSTSTALFSLV